MKKYIVIALTFIAAAAYAGIETSGMYQEYIRREGLSFTKFEKDTVSKLQLAGVKAKEIVFLKVDEAAQTFTFENIKEEICSGKWVGVKVEFTCATKWTKDDEPILVGIYKHIPKEKIVDLEIFTESGKFVFATADKEICHGEYLFGKTQIFCFTKAGVMSFFAGGDAD